MAVKFLRIQDIIDVSNKLKRLKNLGIVDINMIVLGLADINESPVRTSHLQQESKRKHHYSSKLNGTCFELLAKRKNAKYPLIEHEKLQNSVLVKKIKYVMMQEANRDSRTRWLTEIEGFEELKSLELSDVRGCKSIENLPDFSNLTNLKELDVSHYVKLTKLRGLEELMFLKELCVVGCETLKNLPNLPNMKIQKD
ncbi:hypothetical protein LguiB_010419 [Lonicera macranthoides]